LTGTKLNAVYVSGKTETVDVDETMVSGFNTQTAGTKAVTVTYSGKSVSYTITVTADTVNAVTLAGSLKKNYFTGDAIDLTGTKLSVVYASGKTASVDVTGAMVTGFTTATAGTRTVTVTYGGKSTTYQITVKTPALVSISMANIPRTEYIVGASLDVTGGSIRAEYEDGTVKTVTLTASMVSGFNSSRTGTYTLTVTYSSKTTSYDITVRDAEVTSVTISAKPKTAYYIGDAIDLTNGRITVVYENGTSKVMAITADMVSGFDTSSAGTKTITVAYGGKTASYTITVTADAVRTVAVTGTFKKIYFIGDDIDLTGAKLNVTYNSGKTASVDVTSAMVSGFNTQTAGTRTVTVTYGGKSTAYSITVKADTVKTIALAGTVRREYYVDDELDLSGTKLDVAYESGKTASIDVTASMVTGFTSATPGNKILYVTYSGKRITYTVTVRVLAVVKVSMANTPKTDYVTGNTLDVTGGTIKVDYENGTSKTIAMTTAMVSGFNSATAGNKTLTVTYNGKQTSYVITVREPDVASITILSKPKTAYFVGDELNITGGRINVKYENNTTKTVNITADMISGFDTSTAGQKDVTVTYGGKTAVYQITVTAVKAVSLTVSKMPAKIRYYTGDELDITGAKITVRYNNSKTEIFDMTDAMVSGFDSSTAGSKRVTVTFEGVSGYINLTVIALAVNSIKLEKAPDKTSYYLDQELDLTGGSMTVTYNSGKTESISMTAEGVTATGYAPQRVGTQTITVRYLNRSVTYSIQMSIDPDNAPVVLDGAGYLKVSDALRMIKTAGYYEIKVYKDITENSLMFPQAATKITVTSVGGAVIKASSVTANTDLVLNAVIAPVQSGGTVSLRAGNNKQLVINKENLELGTVSGSKTSSLFINANVKAQSVSTFGTVKTAGGSALEITRTMSGVDLAEGTIKLSTAAASCMATIVNSGNTEFILTAGAQNVSTGKLLLPKVTFTKINEGCKLRVKVVDGSGSMVILPASQPVIYTTGTLSYTNSIVVENAITGHDSNIKAFIYQREYRAEYAKALTLECSTGKISGDYSTFEALFNAINSNASDTSAYYRIVLNNDVTAEKFTLPARAGIGMEIDGASHVLDLYGVSSLSPRYAFTLRNMQLRSYNARAARDMDISITATTGDLTLDNISSQHLTAVRGSANTTLNIENYDDMGMAPAIQTFKAVNLINSSITSGKAFNASELNIDNSVFTAAQATVTISKSIHGENNARIALVNGFRPITINGTASGSISLIGTNGYMPAENTQILNSLTADVTVFDVTAIVPDNGITYGLARNGRVNKVTLNGLSLCVNDTKFAFWSEAVTFIESGNAVPAADGVYEIKLLGDYNIGSRIYFPRNKAVRIVSDDPATLTFTSFISPTAGIEAENISLVCMNMNGLPIKYSISCSAADAVLRFKNCDMMTCMSITAARSTVILEGTTCFGGLTVSANELVLDKNVVCRFEGMTVNKLTVDDNMHINILDRRSYRVVSGLYGKELSVTVVNAQDQPVSITRGTVIVFTGYTEQYDNNVYVTNYNEYAVKDRSNRLIINVV
ncbi:MAG: bacterial Ig-like domain-containing protein, partial [Oscillospiraceae bacterium]|nr:bacterial Ig-like domain-containing protein [Oscillospiraceae bacterium]